MTDLGLGADNSNASNSTDAKYKRHISAFDLDQATFRPSIICLDYRHSCSGDTCFGCIAGH